MKNKIIVISVACILILSGCEKYTTETTDNYHLPPELSDCKIFKMTSSGGSQMTVVRCPNSTTTTKISSGRISKTIAVTESDNFKTN